MIDPHFQRTYHINLGSAPPLWVKYHESMDNFAAKRREWVVEKQSEQLDPLIFSTGTAIVDDYNGPPVVRWFNLKYNARTSYLDGPRKLSRGIIGAAPMQISAQLLVELAAEFPTYNFFNIIDEDILSDNITLNDITLLYLPYPDKEDHIAIYNKTVEILLILLL